MKKIILILLATTLFISCKRTYYNYDIKQMEKACENNGGVNRFNSDMNLINCYCNDGAFFKLKPIK